mgnify:CR=1 FL=1
MDIEALKIRRINSVIRETNKNDYVFDGENHEKAENGLRLVYKKFDLAFKAGAKLADFPIRSGEGCLGKE